MRLLTLYLTSISLGCVGETASANEISKDEIRALVEQYQSVLIGRGEINCAYAYVINEAASLDDVYRKN